MTDPRDAEIARLTRELAQAEACNRGLVRLTDEVIAHRQKAEAERDAALARQAGAYEAAAAHIRKVGWLMLEERQVLEREVRALTPADSTAALDRMLRQARVETWEKAEAIARERQTARQAQSDRLFELDSLSSQEASVSVSMKGDEAGKVADAILAASQKEADHPPSLAQAGAEGGGA